MPRGDDMAKQLIKGQVLASTGPTANGTPIPPDALNALFDQTPTETYLYQHHDPALPPVGRLFNKRLEQQADGTVRLNADVEFEEGADLTAFRGFSVSFLGNVGFRSKKTQAATICLDVRYFDEDDLRESAGDISDELGVGSRQLFRYSVGATIVIVVVTFVSIEFAKGFFSQAGKNLFSFLQDRLASLTKKQAAANRKTEFDFTFEVNEAGHTYQVHVRSDLETLKIVESGLVSLDDLRAEVAAVQDPAKVAEVLARLSRHPPYLRTEHVVPRLRVVE